MEGFEQIARIDHNGQDSWLGIAVSTAHVAGGVSRLSDDAFVEVNDAFCRLFRYERSEIIGHTAVELGLWPDLAQRERLQALLLRHGAVTGFEARYRNHLGECGELAVSARIVAHGGELHLVGFLTEITQQREMVEGLRRAQARLGVVLRSSGVVVFAQDAALRYTWVANPALGTTEEDLIGRTDEQVLGREGAAPLVALKRRVLATGRAERGDVWVANNGHLRCFDLAVEPERDAAGRVLGIVCAAQDVTQRMTAPGGEALQQLPTNPPPAPAVEVPLHAIEGMAALIDHEGLSQRQAERLTRIASEVRGLADGSGTTGAARARDAAAALRERHGGQLVLVAEQNPIVRELLAALLESAGLRTLQAESGVQAFSLAVQHRPALLLLDMQFPQRGGVAAARALRTTLSQPMPIIATIWPSTADEAGRSLDADLDDVIDKPIRAERLFAKVLAWLEVR